MGRHPRVGTPLEQALDSARHRLEPAGQPKDNKVLGSPAQPSPIHASWRPKAQPTAALPGSKGSGSWGAGQPVAPTQGRASSSSMYSYTQAFTHKHTCTYTCLHSHVCTHAHITHTHILVQRLSLADYGGLGQ